MTAVEEVDKAVHRVKVTLWHTGEDPDNEPEGYRVDFYSDILGDPFLVDTNYLPTLRAAEMLAGMILPMLNALATLRVLIDPATEPNDRNFRMAASPWTTITSAERDDNGDPVHRAYFRGPTTFEPTDEERALLDKVRAALNDEEDA